MGRTTARVGVQINTDPSLPTTSFAVRRQFEKLWLVVIQVIQCERIRSASPPPIGEAQRVPGAKIVIDSVEPFEEGTP